MTTQSNRQFIQRFINEVINAGNLAAIDRFAPKTSLSMYRCPAEGRDGKDSATPSACC